MQNAKTHAMMKLLPQYLLDVISMATSVTHDSAHVLSWEGLVKEVQEEVMKKVQQENPELLTNTFLETMKFLFHTHSSRELMKQ